MYTDVTMRIPFISRRPRRRRDSVGVMGGLRSETKRAVLGVGLLLVALIAILSVFGLAGPAGVWLLRFLRLLFGWLGYVSPLVLGVIGAYAVRPFGEPWPKLRMVGAGLLLLGLLGLFHSVGVAPEDAYQVALEGRGGGMLGFTLSFPLVKLLSIPGSLALFAAAVAVGIFLTFNLSPAQVWEMLRRFVPERVPGADAGDADEYEDGEGEEDEGRVPLFRVSKVKLSKVDVDPQQLQLQAQEQKEKVRRQLTAARARYHPFSLELLHPSVGKPESGNVEENKRIIQEKLEQFDIEVAMGKVSVGPTVTQYTLQPQQGVKLARIVALQNDLALALAAHPIRIEAPIPGTSFVGIEIPNRNVSTVRLRELLASKPFRQAESPLTIAVGKDVAGKTVVDTLERMPHMLIAGATGSGKSIFINTLLLGLLYNNSPSLLRLILVDPKRVELSVYNNIPHLLTPVIVESEKTINALRWAVREMERRYRVLSEVGSRNLMSFNSNNPQEAMPMIVIVIDELADLMAKHARDVEGAIVRLSQMARAVGIHLVLATQRPSVNVITGLIKANIPTRVAFNVASQVDSRTILDAAGAEKLLGSGDMLYLRGDRAKPLRVQGGFISEDEVHRVVKDIIQNNPPAEAVDESITERESAGGGEVVDGEADDALFEEAKRVVVESGKASSSLLQRRLRVGYARAARLIDMLEERGVIGAGEGNKPREVLVEVSHDSGEGEDDEEGGSDDRDTFVES